MKRLQNLVITVIAGSLSIGGIATGFASSVIGDAPAGTFSSQSLEGWDERSFEGNTEYELVSDDGVSVLKAHTKGQASVLYRTQKIDVLQTPMINWSWKADRTYKNIDQKTRKGDDFPARLYVVVKDGLLPWETLAINYVWTTDIPVGETWANPFTEKAVMVSVQSGDAAIGKWAVHSRNVVEDFKTLFNRDITELDGFAVMVDGDNANMEATAWFGDISFVSDSP